jgi:4-hydroxybenzoate polyprenyltransferase
MMKNIKKDPRPISVRLWIFQRERAPLIPVIIMGLSTAGIVYLFSDQSWWYFIGAATILALYLLQIRTADEHKDFEHDNKYHPNRPVQRGIVTLSELAVINKMAIVGQLVIYASFLQPQIFLIGLLSQGYAFLTRKEFFVRDWIRQHFYIYYISHYVQLVILFLATTVIIQPKDVNPWVFVLTIMLAVITTEIGRKMLSEDADTIDDTYSAQLGHTGSAIALSLFSLGTTIMVYYFLSNFNGKTILILLPVTVLAWIFISAYRYSSMANEQNADQVEKSSALLYIASMVAIIVGLI